MQMRELTQKKIKAFQQRILEWYEANKRDLPWRKTRDPYHILVSEMMLQQTQVSRVITKYEAWFLAFPSLESLAKAKTTEVLRMWSGLGYNRRALYLQQFAKDVVEKFGGTIPQDEKLLRTLPGIGEYTARALLCFGFDHQIAVVDTNIRKVILTEFGGNSKQVTSSSKQLRQIADRLLPQGKAYQWNQALMDYASAMLKDKKIPIPKQSTFVGSDRYYRGAIVRLLLKNHTMTVDALWQLLPVKKHHTREWFTRLLQKMEKDGLVTISQMEVKIKE